MSDTPRERDTSASGNRWEAAGQPGMDDTAPLAGQPAEGPAVGGTAATASPPGSAATPAPAGRGWRDRFRADRFGRFGRLGPRARTGLAAGAAALVVGGIGGFAVGQATAGDDAGPGTFDGQRFGAPGHLDRDGDGDHRLPPPGQLPGQLREQQSQVPGDSDGSTGDQPSLPDQDGTDS